MSRPHCPRRIAVLTPGRYYKPQGIPMTELQIVELSADEIEALRLADVEKLYQADAAASMGVSRQTFARILSCARRKVSGALVSGYALRISEQANGEK